MSNERRRTVSALGFSEPPPQQVNVRCKSPGCDELCYPGDDYCCRFCKEIAEDKTGRLPLPPPAAVGLIGARTARPTGDEADPAQYNLCDSPDCLEPACLAGRLARPALWRLNFPLEGEQGLPVLPTDSDERKEIPIFSGVMNYFPLALAAVARHSKRGNDKHNPGQPLHWSAFSKRASTSRRASITCWLPIRSSASIAGKRRVFPIPGGCYSSSGRFAPTRTLPPSSGA